MINNNDLYEFHEEQDSSEIEVETSQLGSLEYTYSNRLLYQTIISICCLIAILFISRSRLTPLQWADAHLHQAINASTEETFGHISDSKFFHSIISNASNLVRLEEITKGLSATENPEPGLKIFRNSVWPVQGSIVKGYGWRYNPVNKIREFSSGVEISALPDAEVMAVADGTIIEINHQPETGWQIVINHGDGWCSIYHYLGQVKVKVGQLVKVGELIGEIGRPNQEKGPLLLLEIKKDDQVIDPLSVLVS